MEINKTVNLFITHCEPEGPFLKVWGQIDKNTSLTIEAVLNSVQPQFEGGLYIIPIENVHIGQLVCAKYKDDKYYRARIVNVCTNGFVEVHFFDYGNRDFVQFSNLRHMQIFPPSFISIPPLVQPFIFAEAHSPGGVEWNSNVFDQLSKELKYREVQCTCIAHGVQYPLVKLYYNGSDLSVVLGGLLQHIPLQAQQAVLLSMNIKINKTMNHPQPHIQQVIHPVAAPTELNTYKAVTLDPGRTYPAYVSFVNDGPCHFSVQLETSLDCLGKLMNEVNAANLKMLEDVPIPGTICLAKCEDDGNICRAVVTNEVDNQFKVFYVDFGNYEVVPLTSLYQIPFKYVLPKVMAIRFALAGVEKPTVTLEMQCAFKKFVDDRLLHMKVLPAPTRLAIPKCELWDPVTETSALEVVLRAARNAYPDPMSLNRGFSQQVKVSYVYSCNRFYVQLCSKEDELLKLMLDLQASCISNDSMDPSSLTVGLPCCALYEGDQKWYRSQIVEILNRDEVKVRYIDYGNEEIVSNDVLKVVEGEQLTVLRPQAIECCLNGYQNMEVDLERDNLLEELILEQKFTMKVVDMLEKKALVELIDSANYNVASLLLDKIASAKSQVSPMLVQANNRIEHRKSFSQTNNRDFKQDRKPGRENKPWNDRPNDKPWRNEDQDNRNNDKYSNENGDQGAWRQQNKGFNNRNSDNRNTDYRNNDNRNNERFNNRGNDRTAEGGRRNTDWSNNKSATSPVNDSWESSGENTQHATKNNWETPKTDSGYRSRDNNDYRNKNMSTPKDRGGWNSNNQKGGGGGGYKKREFKREGSEISSSGSERSFNKGPRTTSKNDWQNKKFDKPRATFGNNDSRNVSAVTINAAPSNAKFKNYEFVGRDAKVTISWFHNPGHFYCQLKESQEIFKKLMEDIQVTYKGCKPESAKFGAPIIGLFPEDNVLYRGQVLEVLGDEYKVYYVDFGNVSMIKKVWPIDKKFIELPAQAICCELNGVIPPEGQWLDPDKFESYFDKEEFECNFISGNNGKTQVALSHNGIDIAQQLVQDGLVLSASEPTFDLTILLGQQFRAVLSSLNSLGDIIITLNSGMPLSCRAHNLETATETFQDNLEAYLQQPLIVYVDNVIDNVLELTFYDLEGNKIVIVNPDEGAYDPVESLCPMLVLYSTIYGYVSYVESTSVFIQPTEYSESISYLLEQLFEHYDPLAQESPIIPEEGFIYAVHSSDSNWYRGKVVSFDDEMAVVSYVDYGNSESVEFNALREILPQFLELPILCIEVSVTVPTENLADKDVAANIIYGESGWQGELQILGEEFEELPPTEAAMTAEDHALDEVITEEFVQPVAKEYVPTLSLGTSVIVSHIDSPTDFYIQLSDALASIEELQTQLQEKAEEMPILETPTAGVLCAAPYSIDQQWYRAQVLDADDDITTVRFIDYGSTDVIDNKTTEIKTLPQNLLTLEVYATRCSLKIKPIEKEWSTAAHDRFVELSAEEITVEFLDQDEKTNYVELYSGESRITEILISENLALPNELVPESKSTCYVSHVNSPSEFWIQLENCAEELESIAEQLSDAESFPELDDLTPGTLCVALFADDGMWYRARILSNTVAGIELLFVDYGNSCLSCNLRQIPEELVVTSPLAQKCSLQKPEGVSEWSAMAIETFGEIAADGQTIFTVRKITTGETSMVELFVDGENILDTLMPSTEEGFIRNYKSAADFQIEKNGDLLPGKFRIKNASEGSWSEECEEYFNNICSKGEQFQIQFLSDNIVRLYYNGKDVISNLKTDLDEKELPEEEKNTGEGENVCSNIVDRIVSQAIPISPKKDATIESSTQEANIVNEVIPDSPKKDVFLTPQDKEVVFEIIPDSPEKYSEVKSPILEDNIVNETIPDSHEKDITVLSEEENIVDEVVQNSHEKAVTVLPEENNKSEIIPDSSEKHSTEQSPKRMEDKEFEQTNEDTPVAEIKESQQISADSPEKVQTKSENAAREIEGETLVEVCDREKNDSIKKDTPLSEENVAHNNSYMSNLIKDIIDNAVQSGESTTESKLSE